MEEKREGDGKRNDGGAYAYWLCSVPGIGDRSIKRLLGRHGSAREIFIAARGGLQTEGAWKGALTPKQEAQLHGSARGWDLLGEYERLSENGIRFISMEDPAYPERLRHIPDAPYALFVKGRLPDDGILSVAVVGARACSEYGRYVAEALGSALGRSGIQVISGMARGIDGISQSAALRAGGSSYGILGCGVDVCYPASNRPLYERLICRGGILSAYPPGIQPLPGLFPARNRIVSGLADAVVVVEARVRSGTLITVDMALEQGREVYAVPGRLTDRLSDGCNRLLQQGAGVVLSPENFVEELNKSFGEKGKTTDKNSARAGSCPSTAGRDFTAEEKKVFDCLEITPLTVAQIMEKLPETAAYADVGRILMRLCLSGAARQAGCGYFCGNPDFR